MAKFSKDSNLWFEMNNFLTLVKYKLSSKESEKEISVQVFDHSDVSLGQGFHLQDITHITDGDTDSFESPVLNFKASRVPTYKGIPEHISYEVRFGTFNDNLLDDEDAYLPDIKAVKYTSLEQAANEAVSWLLGENLTT